MHQAPFYAVWAALLLALWLQCCLAQQFTASSSDLSPTAPHPTLGSPQSTHPDPQPTHLSSLDLYTQGSGLSVGGSAREGHLSPGALVQLPVSVALRRYTSISVRTCAPGPLLRQEGPQGDSLLLEVTDDGLVSLTLTRHGSAHTVTANTSIVDNQWHHVFFRFELGVLSLGVDRSLTEVANSTGALAQYLDLDLWASQPVLTVGGGAFSGCVLEGAGVPLSQQLTRHTGVEWGRCSLPDGRNCSGYDTDPCFSSSCGSHGQCVATNEGRRCQCYARYTGPTCLTDMGPLCQLAGNACLNGGICQEDWRGNRTSCACAAGYTGHRCERPITAACDTNPCLNGGVCEVSQFGDMTSCVCPEGVSGQFCEVQRDECASAPCLHGGLCTDLINGFQCDCHTTGYRGNTCSENIDECSELTPCSEGATCFDLYGGFECACPQGYYGPLCDTVMEACSSLPCQHGGTCHNPEPGSPGAGFTCQCPPGYEGHDCGLNVDDCVLATCPDNSHCVDGVNEYTCRCDAGLSGSPPNCTQIDECDSNPCQNGATCFDDENAFTCFCAPGFTGTVCEENINECAGGPCLNGGSCVDGVATHQCACAAGFTGANCQTNIDECELGLCQHATSCNDTLGGYECVCEPGWEGTNCDQDTDECSPNPCMHEAVCTDRLNAFHCACPTGYTGPRCEINRDECAGVTCLNGGECIDGLNNYTCACLPAFTGLHCAERYDACSSQPCQHGALCITMDTEPGFYCECASGFEGLLCSNNVNECIGAVCPEGRVCQDLINSYECRCPAGYTGETCQEDIDECASGPCLNDAECFDSVANYTCVCPSGYVGHNCEEDMDECEATPDLCNHGLCHNTNGSYQCYCRPGFSGDHCHLEFDECLSHPCRNNGSCINEINGYQCICQPGFTGMDCEVEIDECEVVPCFNGATCIDQVAAFTCVCVPGFTDQLCSTNIDECEPMPCENEGECLDGINSYTCNCSDTGFKGDQCQINIDDCDPLPCEHGANCTDLIKDYTCNCFSGYEGKNCEVDVPECSTLPCLFGGTCFERSNMTLYEFGIFENFTYETAGGYECQCIPGFTGVNCEINIDECESSPCIHGACIDGINSYACECSPGYTGVNCEVEIDECEMLAPCQHGTCEDQIADYNCACHEGYGGKNCSVALLGCLSVDCLHGGSCEALLFEETHHDFHCHCEPGFTGRHCEDSTTFSVSGTSYLLVNSPLRDGYSLEFWFRTTLASGLLAVGQGETYFILELRDGALNLQSSLLNQLEGIFAGHALNTGAWQQVRLLINESHVLLAGGEDTLTHPIAPLENHTTFTATVLGGATPTLKVLYKGSSFFTGCMQDAVVNDDRLVPSQLSMQKKVAVVDGCPRVEQCSPNPCHNSGRCHDLWKTFDCQCRRPYLGDTCQLSFTAATFGHEALRDSLVSVAIPAADALTFRTHLDVSLVVRTRQPEGLVFYIGTHINDTSGSYVLCSLVGGRAVVRLLLGGNEELFHVEGQELHDGEPHLLQVTRHGDQLKVLVDEVLQLNTTLSIDGDFTTEVMYLGGLPPTSLPPTLVSSPLLSRARRQLGTRNDNDDSNDNRISTDTTGPNSNSDFDNNAAAAGVGGSTDQFNTDTFNTNNFNTNNFNTNSFTDTSAFPSTNSNQHSNVNDPGETIDAGRFNNVNGFSDVGPETTDDQFPHSSARPEFDPFSTQTFNPQEGSFESASPQSDFFPSASASPSDSAFPSDAGFPSSSPSSFPSSTSHFSNSEETVAVSSATPQQRPTSLGPVHFKGVLQDIRVSNGSSTRLVQPFLLRSVDGENFVLPGTNLNNTILHNVLEGTVSDAACNSNPCFNGATCSVTWNDYHCECTFGFKGKSCDELEYCAMHSCPDNSTCLNLHDGYECLADRTMNGVNTTALFRAAMQAPPPVFNQLSITYRSQVGGVLMWLEHDLASVLVGINRDGSRVVVLQTNQSQLVTTVHTSPVALDGDWHRLNVTLDPEQGVTVLLDNVTLSDAGEPDRVIVDLRLLALNGTIQLGSGGGQSFMAGFNLIQEDYIEEPTTDPSTPPAAMAPYFRGCFGEVRLQGILLPSFPPQLLEEDTARNKFQLLMSGSADAMLPETGCRVCYDHECEHGGYCGQPDNNYTCSCLTGFEGDLCQVNINDCVDNECQNGAFCRDGINNYICECVRGYEGERCELDIDECAPEPCLNGGNCTNEIGMFSCACTEDYIGDTCADLKINNCESKKCQNNATCRDRFMSQQSQIHQIADNYTCTCLFGYSGHNCDIIDDYCDMLSIDCHWGTCRLPFQRPGWQCECNPGYEGELCDQEVDECASGPCANGAACIDQLRQYQCSCAPGWQGPTCEEDIDECLTDPCQAGSNCTNLQGGYLCMCPDERCGQTCRLDNPCMQHTCENEGVCVAQCDEQLPGPHNNTLAFCECAEGWGGAICDQAHAALSSTALAILIGALVGLMLLCAVVGLVVFLMMAKKKRATRGTYSPSRQEFYSPRVEMDAMMKPPPEERLI